MLLDPSTRKDVSFARWLVAQDAFDTADSATSKALYEVCLFVSAHVQVMGDDLVIFVAATNVLRPCKASEKFVCKVGTGTVLT